MRREYFIDFEIWRDIPGYEGLYAVSTFGRVKSYGKWVDYGGTGLRWLEGRILKPNTKRKHYLVYLYKDKVSKTFPVHLLVLFAFVGPRPDGMWGCHNDDVKGHNHVNNLRWDTPKANHADGKRNGCFCYKSISGEHNPFAKLTAQDVIEIRKLYALGGTSHPKLGMQFGVSSTVIHHIIHRNKWKHI